MIAFLLLSQLPSVPRPVLATPIGAQPVGPTYTAESGYGIAHDVVFPAYGAQCTLPDGSRVVFDGIDVKRVFAGGETTLMHFAAFVFPSFVVPSPSGAFVCIGESSHNDVFRVPVDGTPFSLITNIMFAYDACFEGSSRLLVSAAPCGFNCGTDFERVEIANGARTTLGHVAGASGPLALSPAGDLVYAQGPGGVPAPLHSFRVLRWSSAMLAASTFLDEANAFTWINGLDGAADLTFDSAAQWFFVAQSRVFGESQVLAFRADGTFAGFVLRAHRWISSLEVLRVPGDGTLESYQPRGSQLACVASDFNFGTSDRALRIEPLRPTTTLVMSSPLQVQVTGGAPDGGYRVLVAPLSQWTLPETPLPGFAFTCFSGAPLTALHAVGGFVALDGFGSGSASLPTLGPPGTHVVQAFVVDRAGRLVASSEAAFD